jgi:hypothetical protein
VRLPLGRRDWIKANLIDGKVEIGARLIRVLTVFRADALDPKLGAQVSFR